MPLNWTSLLTMLFVTLAAIATGVLLLDWLFPRLHRREPDENSTILSGLAHPQEGQLRRGEAALVLVESAAAAHMTAQQRASYWRNNLRLIMGLLMVWLICAYLPAVFAAPLNHFIVLTGFPLGYYLGAQGSPLMFLILALIYALVMGRRDQRLGMTLGSPGHFRWRLLLIMLSMLFALGLITFVEQLSNVVVGGLLVSLTIGSYSLIGLRNRAATPEEYYVANRRIPASLNGLAIAADWMSAATTVSLAGTLWLLGYEGLAYIIGWTGGYVLLTLLLAPYLRKFGQFTIPDLLGARFGGSAMRLVAAVIATIISFIYLTAQVSGVGIIMSRFFGVNFIIGVGLGLSAVLFCSYLGGMKAISWTQVIQGVVLIVAYLLPVTWLAYRDTGIPLPQLMYGRAFAPIAQLEAAQAIARSYIEPYNDWSIWYFLALTTCLMCGTAGMPHILIRFYTTPTVAAARHSTTWALSFILLVYLAIPAYAAFARWDMLRDVVGQPIAKLPNWADTWGAAGLLSINDANHDGLLQLSELRIHPDLIVLATPEIVNLPHPMSALAAVGGLAAALSTADGLLLVITSAVAHDVYYNSLRRRAGNAEQLRVGRVAMLIAAILAGLAAMQQLGIIVEMVAWAFSLAAASLFPVLVLGIFWKRANKAGALSGMLSGLVITLVYIAATVYNPAFSLLGIASPAAGIFGMPINFIVCIIVSLLTPPPPPEVEQLVDTLRRP